MKKKTITFEQLEAAVQSIDVELRIAERMRQYEESLGDSGPFGGGLGLTPPVSARDVGRGLRAQTCLFFVWAEPALGPEQHGIADIVQRLRDIPGVEHVGQPELDTQLRWIWGIKVVFRLSQ